VSGDSGTGHTVEAYRAAHLSDEGGYSRRTHSFMREDVVLHMYEISLLLGRAFATLGWTPSAMEEKRVLEVGCAWGLRLNQLLGFPFTPQRLCGIDLLPEYVAEARRLNPAIRFETMSATAMSFEADSFDLSLAVMALSAMLDAAVIDAALDEMCRVSREAVVIVDSFAVGHEDSRHGAVFFRSVAPAHLARIAARPDVASVTRLGTFWTSSRAAWRAHALLHRIAPSVAYALAIRLPGRHSHHAYLVRMRPGGAAAR
jgi:hypothetical protein